MVQSVHQPTRYLMKVDSEMGELRAFTFISEASFNCQMTRRSAAASRWAGYALAHPEFGSSVNPITSRGQIMPTTLLLAHPDLKTQRQLCMLRLFSWFFDKKGNQTFNYIVMNFDIKITCWNFILKWFQFYFFL